MSEGFTAVLLAGGRSRRMGEDKAFLEVDGQALWERQVGVLKALDPVEVILSHNVEQRFPAMDGVELVEDVDDDCGPLGGVVACLERAECERVLVLGVDLPFVREEFLRELLTAGGGVVLKDEEAGRFEAVVAVYTRACLPVAKRRLAAGKLAMQGFIRECVEAGWLRVVLVGDAEKLMLRNWNRPGDLGE